MVSFIFFSRIFKKEEELNVSKFIYKSLAILSNFWAKEKKWIFDK